MEDLRLLILILLDSIFINKVTKNLESASDRKFFNQEKNTLRNSSSVNKGSQSTLFKSNIKSKNSMSEMPVATPRDVVSSIKEIEVSEKPHSKVLEKEIEKLMRSSNNKYSSLKSDADDEKSLRKNKSQSFLRAEKDKSLLSNTLSPCVRQTNLAKKEKEEKEKYLSRKSDVYTVLINDMDKKILSLNQELKTANKEKDELKRSLEEEVKTSKKIQVTLKKELSDFKMEHSEEVNNQEEKNLDKIDNLNKEFYANEKEFALIIKEQKMKINQLGEANDLLLKELESTRNNHLEITNKNNSLVKTYKNISDGIISKYENLNKTYNDNFSSFLTQVS